MSSWDASSRPTRRVRRPATAEPCRCAQTHATLALQVRIHPKVVSDRLEHATVSISLDTYSHAIPAMQEVAAALIAELVFARA